MFKKKPIDLQGGINPQGDDFLQKLYKERICNGTSEPMFGLKKLARKGDDISNECDTYQNINYRTTKDKTDFYRAWNVADCHLTNKFFNQSGQKVLNASDSKYLATADIVFTAGPYASQHDFIRRQQTFKRQGTMCRTFNQLAANNPSFFQAAVAEAARASLDKMIENSVDVAFLAPISVGVYANDSFRNFDPVQQLINLYFALLNEAPFASVDDNTGAPVVRTPKKLKKSVRAKIFPGTTRQDLFKKVIFVRLP